jgi:hypothetical protein
MVLPPQAHLRGVDDVHLADPALLEGIVVFRPSCWPRRESPR